MKRLTVGATIEIERPRDEVRQQFGDVAHHAVTGVHRGVRFTVLDDDGERCRYEQATRIGPLRLRQELVLPRSDEGPLVNTITKGQFTGGTITFTFTELGPDRTKVRADLDAELAGVQALAGGVLRANVRRSLERALVEDKHDIEQGADAAVDP